MTEKTQWGGHPCFNYAFSLRFTSGLKKDFIQSSFNEDLSPCCSQADRAILSVSGGCQKRTVLTDGGEIVLARQFVDSGQTLGGIERLLCVRCWSIK